MDCCQWGNMARQDCDSTLVFAASVGQCPPYILTHASQPPDESHPSAHLRSLPDLISNRALSASRSQEPVLPLSIRPELLYH